MSTPGDSNKTLFTTGDVAMLLGVPLWRLHYLLGHGQVPSPPLRVGKSRAWTAADIEEARRVLGQLHADPSGPTA